MNSKAVELTFNTIAVAILVVVVVAVVLVIFGKYGGGGLTSIIDCDERQDSQCLPDSCGDLAQSFGKCDEGQVCCAVD